MDHNMDNFTGLKRENLMTVAEIGREKLKDLVFTTNTTDLKVCYLDLIDLLSALQSLYGDRCVKSNEGSEGCLCNIRSLYEQIMEKITFLQDKELKLILSGQNDSCILCLKKIEFLDIPGFWNGKGYCQDCWWDHRHEIIFTSKFDKIKSKKKSLIVEKEQEKPINDSENLPK